VLNDGVLIHVDETTGEEGRTSIGPAAARNVLAVGLRAVWAATDSVTPIDPATDRAGRSVRGLTGSISIAVDPRGHRVLTLIDGGLAVIDPARVSVVQPLIDVGTSQDLVIAGPEGIWLLDNLDGTITPVSDALVVGDPIRLQGDLVSMAAADGAVWVVDASGASVVPVDATSGEVGPTVDVGSKPVDVAAGDGAIWVASVGEGTITEIDTTTRTPRQTIDIGAPVAAIDVDPETGMVWAVVARLATG
jgi:hypothetical protein